MWLIYYTRTHIILAPAYRRYWNTRIEALEWAELHGYDLKDCKVVPCIWPEPEDEEG